MIHIISHQLKFHTRKNLLSSPPSTTCYGERTLFFPSFFPPPPPQIPRTRMLSCNKKFKIYSPLMFPKCRKRSFLQKFCTRFSHFPQQQQQQHKQRVLWLHFSNDDQIVTCLRLLLFVVVVVAAAVVVISLDTASKGHPHTALGHEVNPGHPFSYRGHPSPHFLTDKPPTQARDGSSPHGKEPMGNPAGKNRGRESRRRSAGTSSLPAPSEFCDACAISFETRDINFCRL